MEYTLKEVSEILGIGESSIKTNFKRTKLNLLKKGIILNKEKIGKETFYSIEYNNDYIDNERAISIYKEVQKDIYLSKDMIAYTNWNFTVVLILAISQKGVFRGSYEDFLNYAGIKVHKLNVQHLKDACEELKEQNIIDYIVDKTDNNYFVIYFYRQAEKDMHLGIRMLQRCKEMQEKYNRRSMIPILKVWLGIELFQDEEAYTIDMLAGTAGVSRNAVREITKILIAENCISSKLVYLDPTHCAGRHSDINVFKRME